MWKVELHFGPLTILRTNNKAVVDCVKQHVKYEFLKFALSQKLPKSLRVWAWTRFNQIEKLEEFH